MASVISGNSLGLFNTSLNILGAKQGSVGNAAAGRSAEGVFVNAANGNLVLQRQDDFLLSKGNDIASLRTYNSQGNFGPSTWNIGVKRQLTGLSSSKPNTVGSTITRVDTDGSRLLYTYDSTRAAYINKDGAGSYDSLSFNATSQVWTWTDGDSRVTENYDWISGSGKLLSQTDTDGNTTSFVYRGSLLTQAKSASGETTIFDYIGSNLTAVTQLAKDGSSSSRVRYDYDGYDRLVRVTVDLTPQDKSIADNNTYVTNYSYYNGLFTATQKIREITQSDGSSLNFEYDSAERVISITDGLGNRTDYSYDSANRKTVISDPLGMLTQFSYDSKGQLLSVTQPAVNGTAQVRQFSYNANGDVTQIADAEGNRLVLEYDANGNAIAQRDEAGNTIKRSYNANNQLLSETRYAVPDPDGAGSAQASVPLTTRYVYDSAGKSHLRFMISAEGRVTEYRYDALGQRIAQIEYTASLYTGAASLETDLSKWLAGVNKMQSQRVDMTYDFRGALATSTSFSSVDSAGNGVRDGSQAVTTYVYSAAGELLKTIAPRSAQEVTSYAYDGMGRLLTSSDALRQLTSYQYDDAGNKTLQTNANGLTTIRSYDRAGRLLSETLRDAAANGLGVTNYFYDKNDRLRMTQDPSGVRQWLLYDNAGRKVAEIDGNGSMTEYLYNKNNQVTKTIAHAIATNLTGLSVDNQGRPTAEALALSLSQLRPSSSAQSQQTWFAYDKAGRLAKTVDASGAVTETQYDGDSRIVKVIEFANRIATATLGNNPTVASIAPLAATQDRITRKLYDNDGLLRATIDAEGYLSELQYNAAGEVWQSLRYANALSASVLAGINPSTQLSTIRPPASASDILSFNWYNARGELVASLNGEGYLSEQRFDSNGNLVQSKVYAKAIARSAINSINASTTLAQVRPVANAALDQTRSMSYDELGRLILETNQEGSKTSYTYDKAGNLLSKTQALGTDEARTQTMRYDLQGRLTRELSPVGAAELAALAWPTAEQVEQIWSKYATSYVYDLAGRRISSTDPLGSQTLYFYNQDGALVYSINAMGEVQGRSYNALDQLTSSTQYGTRLELDSLNQLPKGGLLSTAVASAIAQIANANLDSTLRFGYTLTDELASSSDALGNLTSYTYNAFGQQIGSSKPITALGNVLSTMNASQEYDRRGLLIGDTQDVAGINAKSSMQYDAFGRLVASTDANGNLRQTSYDRLGRVVQVSDALQATNLTTYDAFDRVLTSTDALGRSTSFSYNLAARSMSITSPEGVVVTTSFNRFGQKQSVKDGNGKITSFSYDANGALLKTSSELAQTTQRYDSAQRLIESVDANGVVTSFFYDAANRLLSRHQDANGLDLKTVYEYDAKGQVSSVTDANGITTLNQYDAKGQLLQQTLDPNGLNLVRKWSFDAQGNTLSVLDANQVLTQYVYDKLGHRIEERRDPQGLNLVTRYSYDKNGNLLTKLDPKAGLTRYVYDGEDRLTYSVSASGSVNYTRYDGNGRVIQTIAYATPLDLTGLPSAPSMAEVQARLKPNSKTDVQERKEYDRDGRLAFIISGLGAVSHYRYDGNGNVVSKTEYANLLAPGAAANSVQADALRDHTTRYVYDALNRLSYEVSALGSVKQYRYDANGNLLSSTAYANKIAAGSEAALVPADALRDQTNRFEYDAANRVVNAINPVGTATAYEYDAIGNLRSKTVHGDEFSGLNQVSRFEYDAAQRLITKIDALGTVTHMDYDGNGNRIAETTYANALGDVNRQQRFVFDADNRLRFAVDASGAVTQYSYDANGKVIAITAHANQIASDTDPASVQADAQRDQTQRFVFDADQRLSFAVDAVGAVKQYRYDALGNITSSTEYAQTIATNAAAESVQSSAQDQTTRVFFDADNQRIVEVDALGAATQYAYDAFGNVIQQTTYAKLLAAQDGIDKPQASAQDSVKRSAYDQDNRLQWSVNAVGAVVGQQYDAFGNVILRTAYAETLAVGAGLDTLQSSAQDQVTRLAYDALNRRSYEISAVGAVQQNSYDVFGNLVRTTRFANLLQAGQDIDALQPNAEHDQTARYSYDANARMTYAVDARGVVSQFSYDTYGNVLQKTQYAQAIAAQDEASSVQANPQTDRTTRFVFDANNRVTASVDAMGIVTQYNLDTFGNLLQKTTFATPISAEEAPTSVLANPSLDRSTRAVFDANNRMIYSASVIGSVQSMRYDAFGNVIAKTAYAKLLAPGQSLQQVQSSAQDQTTRAEFDAENQVKYVVDARGAVTQFAYDSSGNLIQKTAYASLLAADQAPATVQSNPAKDQVNRFVFDADDKMIFAVDEVGAVTQYRHDAFGNVVAKTVYANQIAANAEAQSVQASAADRTSRAVYDAANQLTYSVDGSGAVIQYQFDAFGNIVAKTSYANLIAPEQAPSTVPANSALDQTNRSVYDLNNQVVYAVNGLGAVTKFERDVFGNILRSTDFANTIAPGAAPETVQLDAARDQSARFTYDLSDRQLFAVNSLGIVTANLYDSFGNVLSTCKYAQAIAADAEPQSVPANPSQDQRTRFAYDLANQRTMAASALGVLSRYEYDSFGNQIASTTYAQPIGQAELPQQAPVVGAQDQYTRSMFDAANQQIYAVDSMGGVTRMQRDAFGNVVAKTTFANRIERNSAANTVVLNPQLDQTTRAEFDANQRLAYAVDASGAVVRYEYDASGNVRLKTAYANRIQADQAAISVVPNPAQDQQTRYQYDAANRLSFSVDGSGAVKQYRYDAQGNLVAQTAFANLLAPGQEAQNVLRDSLHDQTVRQVFDAANQIIYTVDGAGAVTQYQYDSFGNVQRKTSYANTINASQEPNQVLGSAQDRQERFVFDAGNRQQFAVDAMGAVTRFDYDSFDNVLRKTTFAKLISPDAAAQTVQADPARDRTVRYTYDQAQQMLYAADANGRVTQYQYDSFGNAIAQTQFANLIGPEAAMQSVVANPTQDRRERAVYDLSSRLNYSVNSLGAVTQYRYDSFGNVIAKTAYANTIASNAAANSVVSSAQDQTTRAVFDVNQRLSYSMDAMGSVRRFQYDAFGNLTSKTAYAQVLAGNAEPTTVQVDAARDQTTRAVFDGANRISYSVDGVGAVKRNQYDGLGNVIAKTAFANTIAANADPRTVASSANDRLTRYEYDAAGRQIKTIYPNIGVYQGESSQSLLAAAASGDTTRQEVVRSLFTSASYDAFGNIVTNRDTAGNLRYQAYDAHDQVVASVDAQGYVSRFERDSFGNTITLTRFAAPISELARVNWGEQAISAASILALSNPNDAQNRSISKQYDVLGQVTQVTQNAVPVWNGSQLQNISPSTKYVYDSFGQLRQEQVLQTNGSWASTYHYYDVHARETATVDAAGYLTERQFDTFGNVLRSTEFAQAVSLANVNTYVRAPAPVIGQAQDRVLSFSYDLANRKTSDTRENVEYSTAEDGRAGTSRRGNLSNLYAYDSFGNLISVTGANQAVLRTYFDQANRTRGIVGTARPIEGNSSFAPLTEFVRDAFGNVLNTTEYAQGASNISADNYSVSTNASQDRRTTMRYDAWGRSIEITNALGNSQYMSYDAAGQLAKQWQAVRDLNGAQHTVLNVMQYDKLGQVTHNISATGQGTALVDTQLQYNAFGEVVSKGIVGIDGAASEYFEYDQAGRLWRSNAGDGVAKVMLYDLQGRQVAEIRSDQENLKNLPNAAAAVALVGTRRTQQSYDVAGNLVMETAADGGVVKKTYDRWGNVLSLTDPRNELWKTSFSYNANNQVLRTDQPGSDGVPTSTSFYYDESGNQLAVRDARNMLNGKTYDSAGNVLTEWHADGGLIRHSYNAFGNEVTRVDAMGNVSNFAYNQLGLMTQMTRPQTSYRSLADLNTAIAYRQVMSIGYDELGRKISVNFNDSNNSSLRYTYDLHGNVLEQIELGQVTRNTYDARDRKASETDATGKTLTWNSDYFGRVQSKLAQAGSTDAANSSNLTQYTYDYAGQMRSENNSNGLSVSYSYDIAGQMTRREDLVNSTGLTRITQYGYDKGGRHISEKTVVGGQTYQDQTMQYDAMGQLKEVNAQGRTMRFNYDAVGNRIYQEENIGGVNDTDIRRSFFAYDAMNRQILVDGGVDGNALNNANLREGFGMRVSYDLNGNRIKEESGAAGSTVNEYAYDGAGQLTSTTKNGSLANERIYDQMGRVIYVRGQFKNNFDAQGRLVAQTLYDAEDADKVLADVSNTYDAAGNLIASRRDNKEGADVSNAYVYRLIGDSYKQVSMQATRDDNKGDPGRTDFGYDLSGNLVSLRDAKKDSNNRDFINDANGIALQKQQGENFVRNFVVNAQVLGSHGRDLDPETPSKDAQYTTLDGDTLQSIAQLKTDESWTELYKNSLRVLIWEDTDPDKDKTNMQWVEHAITDVAEADRRNARLKPGQELTIHELKVVNTRDFVDYQKIDQSHPGSGMQTYRVGQGDTLRSIAQKTYGDSQLWYLIADANGLFSETDLQVGQTLLVPSKVSGTHNNAGTFQPYDPSATIGDTSPYVPPPSSGGDHCAMIGIMIAAVLAAVIITIVTAGAASAALAAAGGVVAGMSATASAVLVGAAAGAVGGALGSAASQGILIAGGLQQEFSWKDVGIGALTGFISGGVMGGMGSAGAALGAAAKAGKLGATIAQVANSTARTAQIAVQVGNMTARAVAFAALNVTNDAISQGINIAANPELSFNWKSLASAAVSGALSGAASNVGGGNAWKALIGGTVGDISGSALGNVIMNDGGFDATQFLVDTAGNVAGGAIGGLAGHVGQKIGERYAKQHAVMPQEIEMTEMRRMSAADMAPTGNDSKYDKHIILQLGDSAEANMAASNLLGKNGGALRRWTPGTKLNLDASGNTRVQIVGHDTDFESFGGAKLAQKLQQDLGLTAPLSKVRLVGCNQGDTAREFAMASDGIAKKVAARMDREWVNEDGRKRIVLDDGYSTAKGAQKLMFERDANGSLIERSTAMSAKQLADFALLPRQENESIHALVGGPTSAERTDALAAHGGVARRNSIVEADIVHQLMPTGAPGTQLRATDFEGLRAGGHLPIASLMAILPSDSELGWAAGGRAQTRTGRNFNVVDADDPTQNFQIRFHTNDNRATPGSNASNGIVARVIRSNGDQLLASDHAGSAWATRATLTTPPPDTVRALDALVTQKSATFNKSIGEMAARAPNFLAEANLAEANALAAPTDVALADTATKMRARIDKLNQTLAAKQQELINFHAQSAVNRIAAVNQYTADLGIYEGIINAAHIPI